MKTSNGGLYFEFAFLFIVIPILLALDIIPNFIKPILVVSGFVYCLIVMYRQGWLKKANLFSKGNGWSLKTFAIRFGVIIISSLIFVWFYDASKLFAVMLKKPFLWLGILFVYSFLSVYPQELMYRAYFFKRYEKLFERYGSTFFIILNALLFSLAHLMLKNELVLGITFIGGLLFATTYKKSRSLFLASVEHAVFGCWLFTVGIGDMLAFPSAG